MIYSERSMSRPHCERSMAWPHCELLDDMASRIYFPPLTTNTASCAAPVSLSVRVQPDFTFPSCNSDSADRRPAISVRLGGGGGGGWCLYHYPFDHPQICSPAVSVHLGWGHWCLNHGPLAHPQLCRGPYSAREIQLTPRIPTLCA